MKENKFKSTYEQGQSLEKHVADIYIQLGAEQVEVNIELDGQQLDVYAEVKSADGFITKVGLDCKNYTKNVGVNEVNKSARKLALLRQSGQLDIPVLISNCGFTTAAKSAAKALGVKTITLASLLNRIADFTSYLEKSITKYENTEFFKKDLYQKLECTSEKGINQGYIDTYAIDWFNDGGAFFTLLGDYGTGKTVFAKRLFWHMAKAYKEDPINSRIPIFIPLKKYRKEINIRSLIIDLLLHDYGVSIKNFTVFQSLNEQGRLFIILDAFDEMASGADESEIITNFREIKSLVCENSKILLTCRTHFFKDQDQLNKLHKGTVLYQEIDSDKQKFTLSYLLPFRDRDIEELVKKYAPEKAFIYIDSINNIYNLKELAKHPILLDMILSTVPEALAGGKFITPSDLYQTYTRFWLDRDDWRTRMSHDQREFFMKELAFFFQFNGITEIHFKRLPKYIRQKFPGLKTFREMDFFEADVRTCTFLVRDPLGNYSFVHRSFCEYFAALCAVDNIKILKWPKKLWKGKSKSPVSWITPETAQFTIELLDSIGSFEKIYSYFQNLEIDGVFTYIILTIYSHSKNQSHRMIFDRIYKMNTERKLGGIAFRNEIISIARRYHTTKWRSVDRRFSGYLEN